MTFTEFDIAVRLTDETDLADDARPDAADASIELSLQSVMDQADNWPGMAQLPQRLTA